MVVLGTETQLGPLQEQYALSTTESSLQSQHFPFYEDISHELETHIASQGPHSSQESMYESDEDVVEPLNSLSRKD